MVNNNVLIIDDHQIVRKGLRSLLQSDINHFVVEEAQTLNDALNIIPVFEPGVILLDYRLEEIDGAEATKRILAKYPQSKIIILTAFDDYDTVVNCVNSGVLGFLLKTIDSKKIIEAVIAVQSGNTYFDDKVIYQLMCNIKKENEPKIDLTAFEIKILERVCTGRTNKEIAEELHMAEKTIRNYLSRIFQKLDVKNRTEAAVYWKEHISK